jgi:hypothetical protein
MSVDLQTLIGKWIEDDEELSKHFAMSGHCIMDRCRNQGIREPRNGRIYGELDSTGVHLYVGSVRENMASMFRIITLQASQPDFFERLRETIITAHNKTQWCKTEVK